MKIENIDKKEENKSKFPKLMYDIERPNTIVLIKGNTGKKYLNIMERMYLYGEFTNDKIDIETLNIFYRDYNGKVVLEND